MEDALKSQIDKVLAEINDCAIACGRDTKEIKLLAVTKTHSVEVIQQALECGIEFIGESRVQEAEEKIPLLSGLYREFHFIGHLQSNKTKKLLALKPTLIHSVDKFSTAKKINDCLENTTQDILIEVNTSGEPSKQGCRPKDLCGLINSINSLPNIRIKGLMTIGALTSDTSKIRDCFKLLRELFEREKMKNRHHTTMQYLSMGMSDDFHIAIEEGANILRLGSVIFGQRMR